MSEAMRVDHHVVAIVDAGDVVACEEPRRAVRLSILDGDLMLAACRYA